MTEKRNWRFTNLTGQRFGRLLVIGFAGVTRGTGRWNRRVRGELVNIGDAKAIVQDIFRGILDEFNYQQALHKSI